MNDVQTHFVAVCPHCAAQLKIRQVYLGHTVRCKQCSHAFRAEEPAAVSDSSDSQVGGASPAIQPWPQKDKIVVTCPSCQDSLRVPRGYIGQAVRCKRCEYKFVVTAPGEAQPQPEPDATGAEAGRAATAAEHQQLRAANQRLQAAWDQLQDQHQRLASEYQQLRDRDGLLAAESQKLLEEHSQLQAEHDRLQAEHDRINQRLVQVTTELESVRAGLGGFAPDAVRNLAEDRAAMGAELDQLRRQLDSFREEQSALARAAKQHAQQHDADLNAARSEIDRLKELLQHREEELHEARAEHEQRAADPQDAAAEAERLRARLAEHEQTSQQEGDRLRAEAERLRAEAEQLRAEAEQLRGEAERLRSEVEELRQSRERDEHTYRDQLACRDEQLAAAREQARAAEDFRDMAERLRTESDQLRGEAEHLRSEVDELRRALDQAEQAGREELARRDEQLAALAETHRQLQDQHATTELSRTEYQQRNEQLLADLDRLQSALPTSTTAQEWTSDRGSAEVPLEALAGLAGVAGPPQPQPELTTAAGAACDEALRSARAEIEDLRYQLTESERRRREMDEFLFGMGIRIRQS